MSAYINGTGFGVCGTNLLRAFHDAGLNPAAFATGGIEYQPHHAEAVEASRERSASFNPLAPSLRVDHQFLLQHHVGRGPRAGYSFFEMDRLTPYEVHQLNALDVVFAPSTWAGQVMWDSGVRTRVVLAQPGVDQLVFNPAARPRWHPELGLPPGRDTTVFFNAGKWSMLKGHDFVLDAFEAAFTPADDVLLVMCCFNFLRVPGFDGPEESGKWREMYVTSRLGRAGKIRVLPQRLPTQYELAALMAAADCGFFPARAEGWNLEAAEMSAMGKEVVLTDYSAHQEYGAPAGCRMVEIDGLEPAVEDPFIPAGRGNWAGLGPNALDSAVSQLRAVHQLRRDGRLPLNRAGVDLFSVRFTWAACAATMAAALGID